jgi:type IV fimbrial biogenesis protein FimT
MKLRQQTGFTLWELLVALLVVGIVFSFGVPNFREFQRNGAIVGAANDLVTGVLRARSEAVKRQVPVGLCLSDDPTAVVPTCSPNAIADSITRGFVVWVDENGNVDANGIPILTDGTDGNGVIDANEPVLMQSPPPGGSIELSANCGYVAYAPTGFTRDIAGLCNDATRAILYCDDRGSRPSSGNLSSARVVQINRLGRGLVLQDDVDVTNALAGDLAAVNPDCPDA